MAMPVENGMTGSRAKRVEAGLIAVQEVEQERDECRREFEELETLQRGLQSEHDALKLAYARMQTEVDTYRRDRDEAVTKLASFEAVFDACLTIMQKHRGPQQGARSMMDRYAEVVARRPEPSPTGLRPSGSEPA